jgi:AraC family transcriptional regulator
MKSLYFKNRGFFIDFFIRTYSITSQMSDSTLKSRQSFLREIPFAPLETSETSGWKDIVLHQHFLPPNEIYMPALDEHFLLVTMAPSIKCENLNSKRSKPITFRQGDVAIAPLGHSQQWRWLTDYDALNLFISPYLVKEVSKDLLKGDSDSISLMELNGVAAPLISSLSTALLHELKANFPNGMLYVDILTQALVANLITAYSTRSYIPGIKLSQPDQKYVHDAIDFINAHLNSSLRLAAIAQACNISVSHLSAVFNQIVGMPVHQFVMYQRIEKAKILLKNSQKSLKEIASELGFSSQAHLTTNFRKSSGVTPDKFRQVI